MRILIVEDEKEFLKSLTFYLTENGFAVDGVTTGGEALELVGINRYDVALLDVNLPDTVGFRLCQDIQKQHDSEISIIMVTARDEISDKIRGFDSGADDYIVKPFDFAELKARIHALIRRMNGKKIADLVFGDIEIIPSEYVIKIKEETVFFTIKEYEILYALVMKHPAPQSLEALMEHVWDDEVNPFSNAARVHIMNIRKKLGKHSDCVSIATVKEKGYYLCIH